GRAHEPRMLALGVSAGVVVTGPELPGCRVDRRRRPELVRLLLDRADRPAPQRPQRRIEHGDCDVLRLVGAVDAVRDEDAVLADRDRRVRTEALHGLLRKHEPPEDDARRGQAAGQGSNTLPNAERPAGVGRAAAPGPLRSDAGEIDDAAGAGGDRDELRLDELPVDDRRLRPRAPAVVARTDHRGLELASIETRPDDVGATVVADAD